MTTSSVSWWMNFGRQVMASHLWWWVSVVMVTAYKQLEYDQGIDLRLKKSQGQIFSSFIQTKIPPGTWTAGHWKMIIGRGSFPLKLACENRGRSTCWTSGDSRPWILKSGFNQIQKGLIHAQWKLIVDSNAGNKRTTRPKANEWIADTQNPGLEKVTPALNMAIFGIYDHSAWKSWNLKCSLKMVRGHLFFSGVYLKFMGRTSSYLLFALMFARSSFWGRNEKMGFLGSWQFGIMDTIHEQQRNQPSFN